MSFVVNLSSLLLGVLLACQKADAIFMWTGPPPAWNQTVSGTDNIQTAVMRVLIGSKNVHLRWNYTLLNGQNILLTTFSILSGNNEPKVLGNVVNGNPIYDKEEYKSRFSISSTDEFSIVTINTLMERDNTTFQCKIYPGKHWAYNIRLEVTAPPKITSISDGRTVNKGDVLSLKCTADGYPAPNITWTRLSSDSVVTMPLNITGEQDEGGYRCTADNGFGNPDSRDVSITLLHPPEIIKPKKATWEIMSGETASIECRAKGIPSPQYVWTNAAGKIVSRGKHLRFLEVSDSEGGNYICNASNILGSASFTLTIQITTPPVSRKPSLLTSTPSTPVSVTPEKKERKESSETSSDDTSRNMLIGVAVGGFVVVAGILTVAVLLCRRNPKRRNKDECRNSQDQRGVGNQSNHHSVFMDGFQNNKMDNPGYTFTQVDMPKKPKKKSKPGETNYADLANFQRSHMSLLSFSSHPPTPVKKPPPYVKTEYAEITHFIRGGNTDLRTPGANTDRNIAGNIEAIM